MTDLASDRSTLRSPCTNFGLRPVEIGARQHWTTLGLDEGGRTTRYVRLPTGCESVLEIPTRYLLRKHQYAIWATTAVPWARYLPVDEFC